MDLTREDFEQILTQKLDQFPTKADLEQQLANQSRELKAHAEGLQAELARMVSDGFDDMRERLDVRQRILELEQKFTKLEEALHIKL